MSSVLSFYSFNKSIEKDSISMNGDHRNSLVPSNTVAPSPIYLSTSPSTVIDYVQENDCYSMSHHVSPMISCTVNKQSSSLTSSHSSSSVSSALSAMPFEQKDKLNCQSLPPATNGINHFSNRSSILLDQSHLQPGHHVALLSHAETIEMYRQNCKKTHHPEMICNFALFLMEAAKQVDNTDPLGRHYLGQAEKLLKPLATRGYPEPQYYLGNLYASGQLYKKQGKHQFSRAFPYFVQASHRHHPEASFKTAKCYEDGLGCKKDIQKAVQYYRKAAALHHPGGMFRLGVAQVNGELGLTKQCREGIQWLKNSMEAATVEYPHAVHELGLIYELGIPHVVYVDLVYAVQLYTNAAEGLGYAPSAFRLGECYEFGQLGCPIDMRLSIHYYTMAAENGHGDACFALSSWFLVGIPSILPTSEYDAYVWAKRAADRGCVKAEYAMGYFSQVGVGCYVNKEEACNWYKKAARHGDPRAIGRLQRRFSTCSTSIPTSPGFSVSSSKKKYRQSSTSNSCSLM